MPGNQQKVAALHKIIEANLKGNVDAARAVGLVRNALDQAAAHDLAALVKQFLRQLPESLFTAGLVHSFAQVEGTRPIPNKINNTKLPCIINSLCSTSLHFD